MNTRPFGQMIELCSEYLSVWCIWLYVLAMSRTRFRVNRHSIVAWMSRSSLLEAGAESEGEVTATGQNHLVLKRTLNHLARLAKWLSCALSVDRVWIHSKVWTIECRFTLKRVCHMTRSYSQMHCTDKYSEHSSMIWPVWPNGWVFV